jgi:hypothetical protein
MGSSVGVAFVLGHWLYPNQWNWMVLTAYIVASGTRGRSDVLAKSWLRVAGAACGTVIATLLADPFDTGDRWAVTAYIRALQASQTPEATQQMNSNTAAPHANPAPASGQPHGGAR